MRDLSVLITLFTNNHFNELNWEEMEELSHLMKELINDDREDDKTVDLSVIGKLFDIYY